MPRQTKLKECENRTTETRKGSRPTTVLFVAEFCLHLCLSAFFVDSASGKESDSDGPQWIVGSVRQGAPNSGYGQRQEEDENHQSVAESGVERNTDIVSQ